jgi:hypothetical protein
MVCCKIKIFLLFQIFSLPKIKNYSLKLQWKVSMY